MALVDAGAVGSGISVQTNFDIYVAMLSQLNNRVSHLTGTAEGIAAAVSFVVAQPKPKKRSPIGSQAVSGEQPISFQSGIMKTATSLAKTYATSSAAVIVSGESGTGKELFSRLIHQHSPRAGQEFVAVNCAALSESLIESEFFGHEKGAFTDAGTARIGHFERASGGTILLDEISEIPLGMQAKLLRVIEEQEVQTVGGSHPRPIDVRVIATTNRDLQVEVREKRFRADLFHRLNVLELNLPPLRQRKADIPLLATQFVSKFQNESSTGALQISAEAMQQLCAYHWPGNVRQLRNVVHRACVVCSEGTITPSDLPASVSVAEAPKENDSFYGMTLADAERQMILAAIRKFDDNKRLAAEELGVTARTLSNKLRSYSQLGLLD